MRVIATITSLVLAALVWTTAALAQSPTGDAYGGEGGGIESGLTGGGAPQEVGTSGVLPFTGLDLGLLLGAGLLLALTGLVLRRVGRSRA